MGHNFTHAQPSFLKFVDGEGTGFGNLSVAYIEGLATQTFSWTHWTAQNCPSQLKQSTIDSIKNDFDFVIVGELAASAEEYKQNGANYDEFSSRIVHDIFLQMVDAYGPKVWFDLYSFFLTTIEAEACTPESVDEQATLFAAIMSASAGQDSSCWVLQ